MGIKKRPSAVFCLIFGLAIFVACSSKNEANELTFETVQIAEDQLEPFLTFEEDSIAQPMDLAFLPNGNIGVLDRSLKRVFIYDDKGTLLSQFGREGKGPGEFVNPINLQTYNNDIYVSDMGQMNRQIFTPAGGLVKTSSTGEQYMAFMGTRLIGDEEYLIPAEGKKGSLLLYKNVKTDSTFYFGEVMGDSIAVFNPSKAKKEIASGEIPDVFKNTVLLAKTGDYFYAFLQSYARIQKYDRSGKLLWEEELKLPFLKKVYDEFVENNNDRPSSSVFMLTYAFDIEAAGEEVYLLMNVPDGENQVLLQLDKKGRIEKKYVFNYPDGSLNRITLNKTKSKIFFIDGSLGRVLSLSLDKQPSS